MKPIAIVLHGPTSAGKSSLARALQDSSDVPMFHISLDAFVEMSRRRDMRSDDELNQAIRLHHLNLQSTLRSAALRAVISTSLSTSSFVILRHWTRALLHCHLAKQSSLAFRVRWPYLSSANVRGRIGAREWPDPSSDILPIHGRTRCASTHRHAARTRAPAVSAPTSTNEARDFA
ncbi:AAA family ATPase [Burkholderia cepacia]|uniref:phosphotransferase-like protein n=1 Tax=Burkholderia cepacia TaxID=292 RepID=UPI0027A96DD4|nr:AAA family ATPase [Burkholderia cepacia]